MDNKITLDQTFASGNEHELEQAVALYGSRLFHYCFGILCDYHEAQDAVQNTFIKAYKKRQGFRGDSSLYTWLCQIAYRTCIDMTRKRKPFLFFFDAGRQDSSRSPITLDPVPDIGQEAADQPFSEETLRALKALTPMERALLYSRACEEKSYQELAAIFEKSEAALRQQYQRVKKKVISQMNQQEGGETPCQTDSTAKI